MAKKRKTKTRSKWTPAMRKAASARSKKQWAGVRKRKSPSARSLVAAPSPHVTTTGVTGLKRTDQHVYDEWHPQLRGTKAIKIFREMSDNDPVVGSYVYTLRNYVLGAEVTIKPPKAHEKDPFALMIANHVQQCLGDMSMTRSEFLGEVLSMVWAGWSWHEIVYKLRMGPEAELPNFRSNFNDGLVGWRKLPIRAQDTVLEWSFDDDGSTIGMIQQAPPDFKRVPMHIENALLFRTGFHKNNPEGRSLLRPAYRPWFFLKKIQELEAIGIERDMAGTVVFYLPVEYFASDATADQQETVENYRKINERMRRGEFEGLVYPSPDDPDNNGKSGFGVELLQSGGRRPMDVDTIIKRLESRIAISVLGEAVLLGMQGNTGSWAMHSGKTNMMAMGVSGVMQSVADVMTRFAIPRLVRANHWPAELSPTWEFGDIETDESTELMTSLVGGVGAGLITPGPEIEQYLRIRMGIPPAEELDLMNGATQDALGRMTETGGQDPDVAVADVIPIAAEAGTPAAAMSVDEAADYLSVNRNVIMGALRRGQLPGARVGGGWRIMRENLDRYMAGNRAA